MDMPKLSLLGQPSVTVRGSIHYKCKRCKRYPRITDCGHCTSCYIAIQDIRATAEKKGK